MLNSIEFNLDITYFNLAPLSLANIINQTKTLSMLNFYRVNNCPKKKNTIYNKRTMKLSLVKPNLTIVSTQNQKKEKFKKKK